MSDFYTEIDDPEMVQVIAEQFYLYIQTRDEDIVQSDFQITTGQSAVEVADEMVTVVTNQEFPQYRKITHDADDKRVLNGYPIFTLSAGKR
ncbi:UNVERIFIED_ORG: hypothetical protein J2806_004440 [Kosakonia oryzae]|uniref:Uncharacterized protein n=1 Tax=Kosakonia radicincitans TaxID=283686 RepID=A0AAX2EW95_9ENTR|nr:hypothetical protein [Kosakonia radicincitans]MDP9568753.1 hypothetical protein [Kosakonia oryzae]SFF16219.1 hypothetical protein SAMN03159468_04020 [Kosakonia radicincitans]SFR22349.1 hypothetical protein SAMN03159514_03813 [Kosakonia radicincitans]SFT99262.1 hypothetical protein SAMN03159428_03274 [Kosakonia radicincitans]SFY15110.1 hypothetical protein SAMN03159436_04004 [Kosakonia radicincitans]